jgi:hypothetical protein
MAKRTFSYMKTPAGHTSRLRGKNGTARLVNQRKTGGSKRRTAQGRGLPPALSTITIARSPIARQRFLTFNDSRLLTTSWPAVFGLTLVSTRRIRPSGAM